MEFKIASQEEELKSLYSVIGKIANPEKFVKHNKMDIEFFNKIKSSKFEDVKDLMITFIEKRRAELLPKVDLVKITNNWNSIEKEVFSLFKKYLGVYPPKIEGHIIVCVDNGTYNINNKTITLYGFGEMNRLNFLIAHESFHIPYRELCNKYVKNSNNSEKNWILSETVDEIVLDEPEFMKYWPERALTKNSNKLYSIIKEKLKNSKSFKQFLIDIHEMPANEIIKGYKDN